MLGGPWFDSDPSHCSLAGILALPVRASGKGRAGAGQRGGGAGSSSTTHCGMSVPLLQEVTTPSDQYKYWDGQRTGRPWRFQSAAAIQT